MPITWVYHCCDCVQSIHHGSIHVCRTCIRTISTYHNCYNSPRNNNQCNHHNNCNMTLYVLCCARPSVHQRRFVKLCSYRYGDSLVYYHHPVFIVIRYPIIDYNRTFINHYWDNYSPNRQHHQRPIIS